MARSIQTIYDAMITEKETMISLNSLQPSIDSSQTLLSDLTTSSRVAVWRLLFFVMAVGIWSLEKLFDEHVLWIENRAKQLIVGTAIWYRTKALEFQYGDALVMVDGVYQYSPVVSANQIVSLASVNEVGGQVLIKVAKSTSGIPEPLTTPELDAFIAYMKKIKFAGVYVSSISRDPDLLKIQYKIYYDPLVMNASGELISNTSIKPVEDAINNYCKELPFDGIFTLTELTDKIQQAVGVSNPVFQTAEVKYGVNPYVVMGDYYNPNAGYLKVDPAFPLTTTITYIPV